MDVVYGVFLPVVVGAVGPVRNCGNPEGISREGGGVGSFHRIHSPWRREVRRLKNEGHCPILGQDDQTLTTKEEKAVAKKSMPVREWIRKGFEEHGSDLLREMLAVFRPDS